MWVWVMDAMNSSRRRALAWSWQRVDGTAGVWFVPVPSKRELCQFNSEFPEAADLQKQVPAQRGRGTARRAAGSLRTPTETATHSDIGRARGPLFELLATTTSSDTPVLDWSCSCSCYAHQRTSSGVQARCPRSSQLAFGGTGCSGRRQGETGFGRLAECGCLSTGRAMTHAGRAGLDEHTLLTRTCRAVLTNEPGAASLTGRDRVGDEKCWTMGGAGSSRRRAESAGWVSPSVA